MKIRIMDKNKKKLVYSVDFLPHYWDKVTPTDNFTALLLYPFLTLFHLYFVIKKLVFLVTKGSISICIVLW